MWSFLLSGFDLEMERRWFLIQKNIAFQNNVAFQMRIKRDQTRNFCPKRPISAVMRNRSCRFNRKMLKR